MSQMAVPVELDKSTVETFAVEPNELHLYLDFLSQILHSCVLEGASVNFLLPFSLAQARNFWLSQEADIVAGRTVLCVAVEGAGSISGTGTRECCGCVLVKLAAQPNQRHRCDIGKMLVSPAARRRGLGLRLLQQAEVQAIKDGRWLLCLDTEADSPARKLYTKQGYIAAGTIPHYAQTNNGKDYKAAVFMYKDLGKPLQPSDQA